MVGRNTLTTGQQEPQEEFQDNGLGAERIPSLSLVTTSNGKRDNQITKMESKSAFR
jgi:hypothetical protein